MHIFDEKVNNGLFPRQNENMIFSALFTIFVRRKFFYSCSERDRERYDKQFYRFQNIKQGKVNVFKGKIGRR